MVSVAFQTLKLQNELTAFQLMPTYTSFTEKKKKPTYTREIDVGHSWGSGTYGQNRNGLTEI